MRGTDNILSIHREGHIQNIQSLFNKEALNQNIIVELKLANQELCQLRFSIDDLEQPDKQVNKIVGLTVESLLNQISELKSVQNKL
ncbi:hypothetical protein [Acinetobacter nectaris]|uniref:hypothetical protein n=1 Tax=Acinetobacter nectaris TaxID=1219382 RepID=UPI001F23938A|nr:hypothetical protein [Acinetobacter nectaris]MCF8999259.1 hypothetical protein [Acinetobacter nectaris]MCF9028134.1 hypothetical protein [Acinetobacter nectaris]